MRIQMVRFFETENDKKNNNPKFGIIINIDELIIDENGKPVLEGKDIWSYEKLGEYFTLDLDFKGAKYAYSQMKKVKG